MARSLGAVFAVLFACSSALAAEAYPVRNSASTNVFNVLEGVALNAAPTARTVTVPLSTIMAAEPRSRGFHKIRVSVFFTRGTATTITSAFSCSIDGTNYAPPTTRTCTAGACALNPLVDTRTTSVTENLQIEYDVQGCASAQVLLGGAGAGAGDLVDVQVVALIAGG